MAIGNRAAGNRSRPLPTFKPMEVHMPKYRDFDALPSF